MPGTAHRVADQQPFRERAAVVRTGCADRKHLTAGSGQDHRILPNVAEQHGAIGEQRGIDTPGEIGAGRLCLVCVHGFLRLLTIEFRSVHRNEVLQAAFTHRMRARSVRTSSRRDTAAPTRSTPRRGLRMARRMHGRWMGPERDPQLGVRVRQISLRDLACIRGLVALVTQADIKLTVPASAVLKTTSTCEAHAVVPTPAQSRRQRAA
jgi:hypothetical protein